MWLVLIISLPGASSAIRMRVWRALRSRGAGILRDGVYLLPACEVNTQIFLEQIEHVQATGGTGYLLPYDDAEPSQEAAFRRLFDREADYDDWLEKVKAFRERLVEPDLQEPQARREEGQLRRAYEAIHAIDYFAGLPQQRAATGLQQLSDALNARFSPDEPSPAQRAIETLSVSTFVGRTWATRKDLWIDRVASAWLIRRFVDPKATFVWLAQPLSCPDDAVGFDFDGAAFSHVSHLVTFEVLMHSFSLSEGPALRKIGALVHYLDVGGVPVAEAPGVLALLAGAKESAVGDDEFLAAASDLFDHLLTAYTAASQSKADA